MLYRWCNKFNPDFVVEIEMKEKKAIKTGV
jgi:hypothetical protein